MPSPLQAIVSLEYSEGPCKIGTFYQAKQPFKIHFLLLNHRLSFAPLRHNYLHVGPPTWNTHSCFPPKIQEIEVFFLDSDAVTVGWNDSGWLLKSTFLRSGPVATPYKSWLPNKVRMRVTLQNEHATLMNRSKVGRMPTKDTKRTVV